MKTNKTYFFARFAVEVQNYTPIELFIAWFELETSEEGTRTREHHFEQLLWLVDQAEETVGDTWVRSSSPPSGLE